MKNILNFLLTFSFTILITLPASATIWRVNNTLSAPDQVDFNELTDAVVAANAGDTIYVEGSSVDYKVGARINKALTIIGPGFLQENNPEVCQHLNATFGNGVSIFIESGADGTYITGLDLEVSNSFSSGIRIGQNAGPISNITITRNRINDLTIAQGTEVSNIFVTKNLFCGGILFSSYTNVDNLHIHNNLIFESIRINGIGADMSNCTVLNNTMRNDSRISIEGSTIAYNYTGRIRADFENISVNNNILSDTNSDDNTTIKTVDPSNICDPYVDDGWGCNTDNWEYAPADLTTTHGAYNGADPFPAPFANLPAWPVIQSCTVDPCGDTNIQVQFQIRTNQ